MTIPSNRICLMLNKDAEAAAKFYAETFPNSSVEAVQLAPSDNPSSAEGDVLVGVSCG